MIKFVVLVFLVADAVAFPLKKTESNPGNCIHVTSQKSYNDIIDQTKPPTLVVVKIGTKGCHGCEYLAPGMVELAKKFKDRAVVLEADYMLVPDPMWDFNIKEVPTILIYSGGKLLDKFGTTIKDEVEKRINAALAEQEPKL